MGNAPTSPGWEPGTSTSMLHPLELKNSCLHTQAVILREQTNHFKGGYGVSL